MQGGNAMTKVTETRTRIIEEEVISYKVEADNNGNSVSICVENGNIVEVMFVDPNKGPWGTRRTDYNYDNLFDGLSRAAINFVAENNPEELDQLISVLHDGPIKEYCRHLTK